MKHTAFLTLLCLFLSFGSFAQKERFDYKPALIQSSIRIGLINSSLNLEYKLSPKMMASADLGVGLVHLQSRYYNRFNEKYDEYDKDFGKGLNFWREWWSPYTSVQIKRMVGNRSRIKYEQTPYANTFTYYGIQLKYNGQEFKNRENRELMDRFRATYQFGALLGRQVEVSKKGTFLLDLYMGIGGISNYKLATVEPKVLFGVRIGQMLWRRNE